MNGTRASVLISATAVQLARWGRLIIDSRRAGEHTSRSREIRRDGLFPAELHRDLEGARQSLRSIADAIGSGALRGADGRAALLKLDGRLAEAQARAGRRM